MRKEELSEEDKAIIRERFEKEICPKLTMKMAGRIGVLNCGFAGKRYKDWNIIFRAIGDGFEIIDFEYDEESREVEFK
ncbi:MAG: hypothetical protein DRG39_04350 [Deltaproteobacteria bacterium]|nr:MAG: hypothetical protein DRG39_04350 [Deltaproteobacteria bacterium]